MSTISWDVTPWSLLGIYWHFGEKYRLHLQIFAFYFLLSVLVTDSWRRRLYSSETSVNMESDPRTWNFITQLVYKLLNYGDSRISVRNLKLPNSEFLGEYIVCGSHGCEYEDCCLLGSDAVQSGIPRLLWNFPPPFLILKRYECLYTHLLWRMRQKILPQTLISLYQTTRRQILEECNLIIFLIPRL
jgi:hypothetical protein